MTNQRPFKFRVWDTETKTFLQELAPYYWHVPRSIGLFDDEIIGEANLHDLSSLLSNRGFVIQQFTGLKDSEGKEVWEGDIVCEKMTAEIDFHGDECNLGRVFFAAGTFMIDGDGPLYDHTYSLTPDKLEDYLVVGNIFETPELLQPCSKN